MSDTASLQDPLQRRLDLMEDLINQHPLLEDQVIIVSQDITILNSFALSKDWEKVEILIKTWSNKTKGDSVASELAEKKWRLSLEIAIDVGDLDLIKKLLEVCGKNKHLRITLPMMAIALEKQDDILTNLLLWGCSLQKDLDSDSILAGLPEQQSRAQQILFNRYCIVRNDEILRELFEGVTLPEDFDKSQLEELANEHRVAMISYLSRGKEPIVVTQDTMWNTLKFGNVELAQLLETLKVESNFKWMESADAPATEIHHSASNSSLPAELATLKGEKLTSFVAMYEAYGGKISGMDATLKRERFASLARSGSFSSCRSRTGSVRSKDGGEGYSPSYIAKAIIESRDDKDWLAYLKGETEELPGLSWMEPKPSSTPDIIQHMPDPAFDKACETLAILQGLSGKS